MTITSAQLSKVLFEARERVSMQADVVESQTGKADTWGRQLVAEIDQIRADKGWSSDGFGGEPELDPRTLALALCEEFSLFVLKPDDELELVIIDGQVNMLDAADHLLTKFDITPRA